MATPTAASGASASAEPFDAAKGIYCSRDAKVYRVRSTKKGQKTRGRVVLPTEIQRLVPWVREAHEKKVRVRCLAFRGPSGGLLIQPSSGGLGQICQGMTDGIGAVDEVSPVSHAKRLRLVRYLAGAFPLTIERNGHQSRFFIPDPVVRFGILSIEEGAHVVCFGAGNILEVYSMKAWDREMVGIAAELTNAVKAAQREGDLATVNESFPT